MSHSNYYHGMCEKPRKKIKCVMTTSATNPFTEINMHANVLEVQTTEYQAEV